VDAGGMLVRCDPDDGPVVHIHGTLGDGSVELQLQNSSPERPVSCRVYLPNGNLAVFSSWLQAADGAWARCSVRFPAQQAVGARVVVTDGATEIWTRLI
jgi:hypothetical protein